MVTTLKSVFKSASRKCFSAVEPFFPGGTRGLPPRTFMGLSDSIYDMERGNPPLGSLPYSF